MSCERDIVARPDGLRVDERMVLQALLEVLGERGTYWYRENRLTPMRTREEAIVFCDNYERGGPVLVHYRNDDQWMYMFPYGDNEIPCTAARALQMAMNDHLM